MKHSRKEKTFDLELNEDKPLVRLILVALFLAIGLFFIGRGVFGLLQVGDGWQEIPVSTGEMNCAADFTLEYRLGMNDASPTAERKQLSVLYSQAAVDAYRLFNAHDRFEGVGNLALVNAQPNEPVRVEPELYEALRLAAADRRLYLGPIYEQYQSLFMSVSDEEAAAYDPLLDPDAAEWTAEAASFCADSAAVTLELLGDDTVCLRVSEEYAAFCAESGTGAYLDFFWMKNAFIADMIADRLSDAGFTCGYLASREGFVRNLYPAGETFSAALFHREGNLVEDAARLEYATPLSLVSLRCYDVSGTSWSYTYADGETRFAYLDPTTGLCRAAAPEITGWSANLGCGELALRLGAILTGDGELRSGAESLAAEGIGTVRWEDGSPVLTGNGAKLLLPEE